MKNILLLAFVSVTFFTSCERTIDFDLNESTPKLVVEATIENDEYPMVFLSNSLNYFSEISPDIVANSFVHNAEIFITTGSQTHKLKEYSIPLGGYRFYYYTIDSANMSTAFKGQLNTSYNLRIVHDGQEYTSSTTIPANAKQIDSIWWQQAPVFVDSNRVAVMIKVTDPPGYGNYIRYFTKRNQEPFYPGLFSVFDDQIIDGSTYSVQVERAVPRSEEQEENFVYFFKGDTVTLKFCDIDKQTYDFWRTMEFSYSSVGNPFSSPTRVLSNISGNALGYFGGYACQFRTIIIPR